MKKSLTTLVLLIASLMVVGRVVNSAEEQAEVLVEEVIVEETISQPEDLAESIVEAAVEEVEEEELIAIDAERDLDQGIEVVSETAGEDLITLTLDDVPLQDVIRMFTRISGANIVAGTNLQGSVTVSLRDVEWKPALDVILDSVDMALIEKQDDIFMVMSRNDLAREPVIADTIVLEFVTVSNVYPVVSAMIISTNGSVTAVSAANALVVQETVERMSQIKAMVRQIDKPRPQVFIEAKFVELNDSYAKQIGIDWEPLRGYSVTASGLSRTFTEQRDKQFQNAEANFGISDRIALNDRSDIRTRSRDNLTGIVGGDSTGTSITDQNTSRDVASQVTLAGRNFETLDATDGTIETIPTYFSQTIQSAILSADDFTLTLSALEDDTGVSVVSNPKVIVANGETASIHVGINQPNIVAVPTGDSGDRFAYTLDDENPYIEIGVKVEVTPQVNTESNITVNIVPELSRLLGFQEVGVAGVSFPITQIRKIETEFNLASGYTVAIGGLTETSDSETVKKIPILGDIPIIGKYIFSHTSKEKVQDEVVIFVTVGLANPDSLVEVTGVPSRSRLIHQHLAQEALDSQGRE